jgi:hypothetical protein
MDVPLSPERILQTGFAFWPAKTLLSAVEMEVFTELARHPEPLEALTARLGLHPRGARDFFDTLVALGFVTRDEDGLYANTPEAELFLDKHKPSYIGGILEMANHRLYPFWGALTTALRTGEPQNEARSGEDMFAKLYADPARLKEFLRAMSGVSRGANLAIARQFPGSITAPTSMPARPKATSPCRSRWRIPSSRASASICPRSDRSSKTTSRKTVLSDRLTFAGGSFFTDPLPKADVVLYGHILHDWDLEQKKHLLRAAWEALPVGGAVVVYDSIIDDARRENAFGLMMSLNMLVETSGGFDYTGADCQEWMREAGFRDTRVEPLVGPDSMVIGVK